MPENSQETDMDHMGYKAEFSMGLANGIKGRRFQPEGEGKKEENQKADAFKIAEGIRFFI